jgi:glutathione S-transferase
VTNASRIVVRYFDARGRGQFIRHYLACRKIEHDDERVELSPGFEAWRAMRDDRAVAGPFHKLPVLHWGEHLVAETIAIAAFLHRANGDEALLTERDNVRHSMLVSSLCIDVMTPIALMIWADLTFPGADVGAHARATLARVRTHFAALDRTLGEWDWVRGAESRPVMVADCLLWEEIDVVRHVFGDLVPLDDLPALSRFYRDAPGRAVFERLIAARAAPITGRGLAAEAETLGKLRALLAS